MTFIIDREYVLDVLRRLVATDSVNPTLAPAHPGEANAAALVAEALHRLGAEVQVVEPEPGRASAVGRVNGNRGGRSLMLNAHIDTVGVEGMDDPFAAEVKSGRLYGRGAYDMKGSMAACLGAVKALHDAGVKLAGDLVVAGVADEEYGSLGTRSVLEQVRVDGAIVTEPTHLKICLAHKGYVWLKVSTEGRAAHGSRFEEGIDANMRMGRVLAELEDLERRLRTGPRHPLVGPPSLHAALLAGGTGLSTYAAHCELQIERRTIPGETEAGAVAEIDALLATLRHADPSFRGRVKATLSREPFEVPREAAIVRSLEQATRRVTGKVADHVGDTPWMDAALLAAAGVETVVFGPAGAGAHAAEEWVDLESVYRLTEVLAEAVVGYCGT